MRRWVTTALAVLISVCPEIASGASTTTDAPELAAARKARDQADIAGLRQLIAQAQEQVNARRGFVQVCYHRFSRSHHGRGISFTDSGPK